MCLIRALRDCKQRSFTVSKKTPTVSKKTSPLFFSLSGYFLHWSGKTDPVQFKNLKKGFRTGALLNVIIGILQAASLLSDIGLSIEKIASKMAKFVS